MRVSAATNLPDELKLRIGTALGGDLNVCQLGLYRVDGIRNVLNANFHQLLLAGGKVINLIEGHLLDMAVEIGQNILNHGILGSGSDHELKESRSEIQGVRVLQTGCQLVRQFLEATVGRMEVEEGADVWLLRSAKWNLVALHLSQGNGAINLVTKKLAVFAMRVTGKLAGECHGFRCGTVVELKKVMDGIRK